MAVLQLTFTDIPDLPGWLWIEWEIPGGIRAILDTWQGGILRRYHDGNNMDYGIAAMVEIENEALNRIHREARALRRFAQGYYRDVLNPIEQRIFDYERECMQKRPHLKGHFRHEWIAERMNQHYGGWTARRVAAILEEITDMLVAAYNVEIGEKLLQSLDAMQEVWYEARYEMERDEAA